MNIFKSAREMAKTANAWICTGIIFAIFDELVLDGRITKKICNTLDKPRKVKEDK